jgi:hypothetical protein
MAGRGLHVTIKDPLYFIERRRTNPSRTVFVFDPRDRTKGAVEAGISAPMRFRHFSLLAAVAMMAASAIPFHQSGTPRFPIGTNLNGLSYWGGGLFMHLLDCGNFENAGNWGAREYLTQPRNEAPKYDALQKWIDGR